MMKPGLYRIPDDEYRKEEGVSKSFLHRLITWTPLHAITPQKETQALFDGKAIHCAIFEPLRYTEEYEIKPDGMSFTTKEGKAWRAEATKSGKNILNYQTSQTCQAIAKAVRERLAVDENPIIQKLLSEGEAEVSGFVHDPENPDIMLKIRIDWLQKRQGIIVDLKSCIDARPHSIIRDAYKFGWDMQVFQYCYVLTHITQKTHRDFYFIAAEKEPPFGVNIFKASEEFMDHGGKRFYEALNIYKEVRELENWPCYSVDVKNLELPGWVRRAEGYNGVFE